jgi:hypothetical protein
MKAILLAAALFAFPAPTFAQWFEFGPSGTEVEPYPRHRHRHHRDWWTAPDCNELRAACIHKYELGEEGRGICRRYREMCRRY